MTPRTLLAVITATMSAALAAQTRQVSPSALTNAYGGINNSIPWGPFVPAATPWARSWCSRSTISCRARR